MTDAMGNLKPSPVSSKNFSLTLLLATFGGVFGAHRIYVGKWRSGLCMFVIFVSSLLYYSLTEATISEKLTQGYSAINNLGSFQQHQAPQAKAWLFGQIMDSTSAAEAPAQLNSNFILNKTTAKAIKRDQATLNKDTAKTYDDHDNVVTDYDHTRLTEEDYIDPPHPISAKRLAIKMPPEFWDLLTPLTFIMLLAVSVWIIVDIVMIVTGKFTDSQFLLLARYFDAELASQKSFAFTYILTLFLGVFGAHRFYTAHHISAAVMLMLNLLGILGEGTTIGSLCTVIVGIWVITDLTFLALLKFKDADGWYVVQNGLSLQK